MLLTSAQVAALYAMRQAAPIFDLDEDHHGHRLVVTTPDGTRRLIDQAGTTYRITKETA